jgi:serine/threonine-protein kinase
MGEVWLATKRSGFGAHLTSTGVGVGVEKRVALKWMLEGAWDEPQLRDQFLDEARVTAHLSHPNVAQLLEVGEMDGKPFIALEWVEGLSLAEMHDACAESGISLPIGVLLRIASDACAGLHAAHELRDDRGEPLELVHRDVSPQNILVGTAGVAKVIDFGIAKMRDRVAAATSQGKAKGKVAYMAPEQAVGRLVDRRADVWGLGATLYRVLSGKPAYASFPELFAALSGLGRADPLPLHVPTAVAAVVEKAMAVDVRGRYQTMREMGAAIGDALRSVQAAPDAEQVGALVQALLRAREDGTAGRSIGAIEDVRSADADATSGLDAPDTTGMVGDPTPLLSLAHLTGTPALGMSEFGRHAPRSHADDREGATELHEPQGTDAFDRTDEFDVPPHSLPPE